MGGGGWEGEGTVNQEGAEEETKTEEKMTEEIKVGDWVWVWKFIDGGVGKKWWQVEEIVKDAISGVIYRFGTFGSAEEYFVTKNPVIPPKPNRTVVKEIPISMPPMRADGILTWVTDKIPLEAKNPRFVYEIEE